jgi:hypothetical protein
MRDSTTKFKIKIYLIALSIVCFCTMLFLNRPAPLSQTNSIDGSPTSQSMESTSSQYQNEDEQMSTAQSRPPDTEQSLSDNEHPVKLVALENRIYHAAFPDFGSFEDEVDKDRISDFTDLVNKDIAWGYFSNNWFDGIKFPTQQVETLRQMGITPLIRLMPRSQFQDSGQDPVYTLEGIVNGQFDTALREWARQASSVQIPLLVEFGTEMNGDWFTWAGRYNGADSTDTYGDRTQADGPEKFKDAYRHIVDIFREEDANNITWFFHVNITSAPDADWNQPQQYYPGDDYVDWIGVSVYGAQSEDDTWISFENIMNDHFDAIVAISQQKPIAILEFGVEERENESKADWINGALNAILRGDYPRVKAISYWHSNWTNADGSSSRLRLDSSQESANNYRSLIQSPLFESTPVFLSE